MNTNEDVPTETGWWWRKLDNGRLVATWVRVSSEPDEDNYTAGGVMPNRLVYADDYGRWNYVSDHKEWQGRCYTREDVDAAVREATVYLHTQLAVCRSEATIAKGQGLAAERMRDAAIRSAQSAVSEGTSVECDLIDRVTLLERQLATAQMETCRHCGARRVRAEEADRRDTSENGRSGVLAVDEIHKIDQDDRQVPHAEAERVAGRRLDRRRKYAVIDGQVCQLLRYSNSCSGCTETPEYTTAPDRGFGCHECGYTGRVRNAIWVPVSDTDLLAKETP